MITQVEVHTANGETLALPLRDVSGGYTVKNIEGLDPVNAVISSSRLAQVSGSQYQASQRENRNVVFTIGIDPNTSTDSVSARRNVLYSYFMPKKLVTLRFYVDDVLLGSSSGRVESFSAPPFSKEPEAVISVICFDPDIIAPSSVVVNGFSVADTTEQEVVYPGSVETGFIFELLINRVISEVIIHNRAPYGELLSFEFGAPFLAGDIVRISTVQGLKFARLTRNSVESSILSGVSSAAKWFSLAPGTNLLRVAISGDPVPFTLTYVPRFGGL